MQATKIEWATMTWNPTSGCTPVSRGCDNCYARRRHKRFSKGVPFSRIVCHEDRLDQPLRKRKPQRIFVNSMSDLFHEDVPGEFLLAVFKTINACRQHTFLILTKRPKSLFWCSKAAQHWAGLEFLPNVWPGVSVEDQATADERIPLLLECPAAVRFVSVDLTPWLLLQRAAGVRTDMALKVPTCMRCGSRSP